MNYALIKNCPLKQLLCRSGESRINWIKYGFTIDGMRLATQGYDADGNHCSLLPIMNPSDFELQLQILEQYCASTVIETDSIVQITEDEAAAMAPTLTLDKAE